MTPPLLCRASSAVPTSLDVIDGGSLLFFAASKSSHVISVPRINLEQAAANVMKMLSQLVDLCKDARMRRTCIQEVHIIV
jgi:hypothetical protein